MASAPLVQAGVLPATWEMATLLNAVIALAYFGICGTILRGLVVTRQLRTNPLAVATAAIFLTCAVHHGAHSVHMVLPAFGVDRAHGLAFRDAFSWQMAAWDGVGAAIAVYYLSLRRTYGALLRTPAMYEDDVQGRTIELMRRERELFGRAEALTGSGSWEVVLATGTLWWSPGMYRLRGREPQGADLSMDEGSADHHPDDRERIARELEAALAGGEEQFTLAYRIVLGDGAIRDLDIRTHVERDAHGAVVRMTGVAADVTERRAAEVARERALHDREEMLSGVIDHNPALIYIKDLDGKYVLYNGPFAHAFALEERGGAEGRSGREVLLDRDDTWLDPALEPAWRANDLRAQEGAYVVDEWSDHPTRGHLVYESVKFPLFDGDGRLFATCGVSLDVTERRRALERLGEAERRLQGAFENAPNGMALIALDGRLMQVNAALCAMTGHSAEELREKTVFEIVHPDELEAQRAVLQEDAPDARHSAEVRYIRADGSAVWTQVHVTLLQGEEGRSPYFIAQMQDITDRRRFIRQLATAHDKALEASRLKSEFVANMSHELRTPLNGVIGMSGLLLDTELSEEQREYADAVRVSGDALMRVINDILDFSKIEAGKLEITSEPFELRPLVEEVSSIVAAAAQAKGVELASWVDTDLPHFVCGDGNRLRQVLTNLLTNAVKFTPAGEVAVKVTRTGSRGPRVVLRFEVADTGIGIEPASLDRIFESFAQQDGSTTRRFGGTGLGLAISKQLVELMGGEMGVRSALGEGSTFWFELPVRTQLRASDRRPPPLESAGLAGVRVLVVDDNTTNRTILERQLSSWGVAATATDDPLAVPGLLRAAREAGRAFELVLVDSRMPVMSGCELTRVIRADPSIRRVQILMLTSSGGGRQEAVAAGVDGFVTKPVQQSRLLDQIVQRLGSGRPSLPPAGPPVPDGTPAAGSAASSPARHAEDTEGRLVLVVEDNEVNQRVASGMLRKRGFRVHMAANGREALDLLERRAYEMVFMDCQMPVLDGYQATAAIRRREGPERHVPIVAMTANTMKGDRERCLASGMDDYIGKPVRPADLDEVIARTRRGAGGPAPDDVSSPARHPRGEQTPIFEASVLEELCADDEEAREQLVELFLAQAQAQVEQLAAAVAAGDAQGVQQLAHKLKGGSAALGARQLAEAAHHLCEMARTGRLDDGAGLQADLECRMHSTRVVLAASD